MPTITSLNGKQRNWILGRVKQNSNPSKFHVICRDLLKEIWPLEIVYEEVSLEGTKTSKHGILFADFLIFSKRIIIEVQGQSHYKFNAHFFENKLEFYKAQQRDRDKKTWCEINDIRYVELPYNESREKWKQRILNV